MRATGSGSATGGAAQSGIGLTADAFARTTINVEGLSCGSADGACTGAISGECSVRGHYEREPCHERRHDRNWLHVVLHHSFPAFSPRLEQRGHELRQIMATNICLSRHSIGG